MWQEVKGLNFSQTYIYLGITTSLIIQNKQKRIEGNFNVH